MPKPSRHVPGLGLRCLVFGVCLALTWGVPASSQDQDGVVINRLEALYVGVERPAIQGRLDLPQVLTVGRARIEPRPGAVLYLLAAHDKPVGYLLDGEAHLTYRVDDPMSMPPSRSNLKLARGLRVEDAEGLLTITTELSGMALWGWDAALVDQPLEPVAPMALPPWLQNLLESKITVDPGRNLVLTARNGGEGYRWAALKGSGEMLLLEVDPRPIAQREQLSRMIKLDVGRNIGPYTGRRQRERLVTQPIDRPWWEAESHDFVAVDTDITLHNAEGDHVRVTTTTRLQVLRKGFHVLPMYLMGGDLDGTGIWRRNEVRHVLVNGRPAPYLRQGTDLLVELPHEAAAGEVFELEVEAEGDVLRRPSGDSYWRLGGLPWYLKPGDGGLEWAEIRMTAEVAPPFVPLAGGEILDQGLRGGLNFMETRQQAPMGTAMVVAGKYRTVFEESNKARVNISSYISAKDEASRRIGQLVLSVQDCLGSWLGVDYPFPDLQVVEVKQWGWGQAPPGFIFITQDAFLTRATTKINWKSTRTPPFTSRRTQARLAHEVAHAWFPHVAKVTRIEENWLSESLSDYTSVVCLERGAANTKQGRQLFESNLKEWRRLSKKAGESSSVYLAAHLSGGIRDHTSVKRALWYGRGPLVLHAIRLKLQAKHGEAEGDSLFFGWLRSYISRFTFQKAETRHLIDLLNEASGEDWTPFFERYIYGAEGPDI